MADRPEEERKTADAEEILNAFFERIDAGDPLSLDELCEQHPELAQELRELYETCRELESAARTAEQEPQERRGCSVQEGEPRLEAPYVTFLDRLARSPGRFGEYRIQATIGSGGMGRVLGVRDEVMGRNLAMKVMHSGVYERGSKLGGPGRMTRFLEEAQIMGQLDHPGIVPLYELGLDPEGRPYFTMKHVQGRTLADAFELAREGKEGWTVVRVITVLQRVCEAMAYAHGRGVIHRDLKPSNVMLGRFGEVYVMDWGLARVEGRPDRRDLRLDVGDRDTDRGVRADHLDDLTDSPLKTLDGHVVGTACYMPPEQAAGRQGEVGQHSDIYAVGAMLYHLLAGVAPYQERGRAAHAREILMRLSVRPPGPLRSAAPRAPGALVAICEKAMARDWRDRYASMQALGEDFAAFVEGRVVSAGGNGAAPTLEPWMKRSDPWHSPDQFGRSILTELRREVREGHKRAGKTDAQVGELLRSFDEIVAPTNATNVARRTFKSHVLEPTMGMIDTQFENQPLVLAAVRTSLAKSIHALDLDELGERSVRAAVEMRRARLGDDHPDTLASINDLGVVVQAQGKLTEAEPLFREALTGRRRRLGDEHRDTLASLNNLGILLMERGELPEAEVILREAMHASNATLGEDHADTLTSTRNLASLLCALGRPREAEPFLRDVVARRRRGSGDDHPDTLESINSLAHVLVLQGELTEGESLVRKAVEGRRQKLGDDHSDTLTSINNLGLLLQKQGNYTEAEPLLREVLDKRRRLGGDRPSTIFSINNLALLLHGQGNLVEAERLYREALDGCRDKLGNDHPYSLVFMSNLGRCLLNEGKLVEAEALLRDACNRLRNKLGEEHPDTLTSQSNLALLLQAQSKPAEAEPLFRRTLEARRRTRGEDHPETIWSTYCLGRMLKDQRRFAEAEAMLGDAAERLARGVHVSVPGFDHPAVVQQLVELYRAWDEAEPGQGHAGKADERHSKGAGATGQVQIEHDASAT